MSISLAVPAEGDRGRGREILQRCLGRE